MKSEVIKSAKGSPLLDLYKEKRIWSYWLGENDHCKPPLHPSFCASKSIKSAFDDSPDRENIFFSSTFAQSLVDDLDDLIEEKSERELVAESITDISSGKARTVVTGQQPGFAGGPLYCLFKIATTVALAKARCLNGLPTVPVFWMGDDDDDWQELVDPLCWDGVGQKLVTSKLQIGSRHKRQRMIGDLPFSPLEENVLEVLESLGSEEKLNHDLREIYQKAKTKKLNLSILTEKILRCVFKGTGLVILRGNDPRLHSQSKAFYRKAMDLLPDLVTLSDHQGVKMKKEFGNIPLSANSLKRPLYLTDGETRKPLDGGNIPDDTSGLRCGVLLRSMLQDWLLDPVAVIVGPGELSYLSQLTTAYECMGISRSPLVPRLFGWILPQGFPTRSIEEFHISGPLDHGQSQELAEIAGTAGEEKLIQILREDLGLNPERARELAAGRTRRWVKGVQALLKNESRKQFNLNRPSEPEWVFPESKRQERKLGWVPAAATWGKPLIDAIVEAGGDHLQGGLQGCWNEYLIRVNIPEFWNEKGLGS